MSSSRCGLIFLSFDSTKPLTELLTQCGERIRRVLNMVELKFSSLALGPSHRCPKGFIINHNKNLVLPAIQVGSFPMMLTLLLKGGIVTIDLSISHVSKIAWLMQDEVQDKNCHPHFHWVGGAINTMRSYFKKILHILQSAKLFRSSHFLVLSLIQVSPFQTHLRSVPTSFRASLLVFYFWLPFHS